MAIITGASVPTERRIHNAALRLFARQGYAATGIRELADEAGLSPSSLYNHIGSKEDLLVRIMRDGNSRLWTTALSAVDRVTDPVERLALLAQVHVFVHASFRQECRVIDAEFASLVGDARKEVLAERDSYEALWADALKAGADSGELIVPDHRLTRLALLSMCTGVAHWFRPEGPNDSLEVSLGHANLALSATRATRGGEPVTTNAFLMLDRAWFERVLPDLPGLQASAQ